MTTRERNMLVFLGVAFGGIAALGAYKAFDSWRTSTATILKLLTDIDQAEASMKKVHDEKAKMDHWRRLSMVSDPKARDKYKEELLGMMRRSGVLVESFPQAGPDTKSAVVHPSKPGKVPVYSGVNFTVRARAKMENLVAFLDVFQKAPRMHRIKTLTIERSDSSARKEAEYMTVQLGIECLSILDADAFQKPPTMELNKARVGAIESIAALRGAPVGTALMAWSWSTSGLNLLPLNPPRSSRNYNDIARKNIFIGPGVKGPPPVGTPEPKDSRSPPTDEFVNLMRYTRFIGLTDDGRAQALIWDYSVNQKHRIKASAGFNKFPLVQTAKSKVLMRGEVSSIADREIIFRVTLATTDPSYVKWWHYPKDTYLYRLHKDDFALFLKQEKVTPLDKDRLFVMHVDEWDKMKKTKKEVVMKNAKQFTTAASSSLSDVVFEDKSIVVIRMAVSAAPPRTAYDAPLALKQWYPNEEAIYWIQSEHVGEFVAGRIKSPGGSSAKVKKEERDRIFVMHTKYWEDLMRQKLLKVDSGGATGKSFTFYSGMMKGDILSYDSYGMVVFRLAEKYCYAPSPEDSGISKGGRWHEGFCVLHIDRTVQQALSEPLSESKVRAILYPDEADTGN